MILSHPIPQRRRHQIRLLTITLDEVLTHPQMVINPPDDTPLYPTATSTSTCLARLCRSLGMQQRRSRVPASLPLPPTRDSVRWVGPGTHACAATEALAPRLNRWRKRSPRTRQSRCSPSIGSSPTHS
jgi:hypothetical protein